MKTELAVKIIQQVDEETAKRFLQHYAGDIITKNKTEKETNK